MENKEICEVLRDASSSINKVYKIVYQLHHSFINDYKPFDNDIVDNRVLELRQVMKNELFHLLSQTALTIEEVIEEIEKQ